MVLESQHAQSLENRTDRLARLLEVRGKLTERLSAHLTTRSATARGCEAAKRPRRRHPGAATAARRRPEEAGT